jgi:hypothetical protein
LEKENKNSLQSETETTEKTRSAFTRAEIDNTVKSFILSWLKNEVKIHFPTSEEIKTNHESEGDNITSAQAIKLELKGKTLFMTEIKIASGTTPATNEEKETATCDLFSMLLAYRCGNRIEGTFGKQDGFEQRLAQIEEQIESINTTVQELVIYYRSMPRK